MATIGSLVVNLVAQTSAFQSDMGKAQALLSSNAVKMNIAVRKVERGIEDLNKRAARAVGGLRSFGNVLLGLAGAAGLGALVHNSLNAAAAIDDVAQKAGVSTAFLQQMRYAASQSGASASDLDDAVTRLNRRLGMFVTSGGGPAKEAIEALGLSVTDSGGRIRSTESIFEDITRKIQGVGSEAEKSALLAQLFGQDAGPRLLQMMNQGAGGIEEMRQKAERLGIVMDEGLIRASKSASDNLGTLGQVIKARVVVAVAELAPKIDALVSGALKVLPTVLNLVGRGFQFVVDNASILAAVIAGVLASRITILIRALKSVYQTLMAVRAAGMAVSALIPGIGWANLAAGALAAAAAVGTYYGSLKLIEGIQEDFAAGTDRMTASAERLGGVGDVAAPLTASMRKAQEEAEALLKRIDERWLQSTGQQIALIERRKAEELAALEATVASAEQKADARVKIEESSAAEIAAILRRGAEERQREQERLTAEAARAAEASRGAIERVTQDWLQATGQQVALIQWRRDREIEALDAMVKDEAQAAEARTRIREAAEIRIAEIAASQAERHRGAIDRIESAWLQATGQQEALIQRRRDAELRMLEEIGLGEEQLARLRVLVNETAAAEIADIHAREAEKLAREQERAAKEAERSWERFGDRTKGVLEDLVQGGKLSLQGLISLADDALQAVLRASGAAGKDSTSTGGLIGNAFASLLGFADGGRPPVGRASIVGERGPELFVPDRPGTIIPNDFGGGLGGGMVVNIDARGAAPGVEALIRREMAALSASIEPRIDARVVRQANRGGGFAKAVGRR